MSVNRKVFITAAVCVITAAALNVSTPAQAGDGGAFIGGVFASHVVHNMRRRTQAEETQAYYAAHPSTVTTTSQTSAAPAQKETAEDRIKQLDKLAAGGYITPAEYKAKKKSILDSM